MTNGHCFISYSNRDAEEFGHKLAYELEGGTPYIDAWFDKRDILPGKKWDEVAPDAIKSCKCLIFAMTKDSIEDKSICSNELDLALRYKKPILILKLQNVEPPFRLADRQWIDFSNHKAGMARLRMAIARLDSPEGQLDLLKERLDDARRDFNNAKTEEEKQRIQMDLDDLTKQIETQQRIVDNPQAAQEQTQKNIEAGLERERQPQMPVVGIKSTKFINPPPGIAPNYFQDRTVETKQVFDFLKDGAQRMLTIVGRGGVGKTAMICRLLKHLENSALPEDVQKAFPETKPISIDGIVYLSESGSHRVNFANIFYDLCKLLPKETAQELDTIYKNPQGSTESKMRTLLEKFTGEPIALLLDNFEPLVDDKTFEIRDTELNEALHAFLNGTHTSVNIVITTRIAPKVLNLVQPGRQRVLQLDDGLESPYAENILRDMDADGRMGLKSAPDALLNRARERTRGYPRALEALFAILASDRYTSLEELLEKPTPENVVQELVGEAFNRLDTNTQKVMQALAVYNRPVTPAAVDYLLAPHLPAIDSAPILQRLASMHFARKESGRFYLHPVDREFAISLLAKGDEITFDNPEQTQLYRSLGMQPPRKERTDFTQIGLTDRAADYFVQARKPRAEWKKLDDLAAQLAEFDLRCAVGDYDTAADVLTDIDFNYLFLWGHYRLVIDLHEKLQGKLTSPKTKRLSSANLGGAYYHIGQVRIAIKYYEQVLELAREDKDKQHEAAVLSRLGVAFNELGNKRKDIEYQEQALIIAREIGDKRNEGVCLGSLGIAYYRLGDARKAIEYFEQALKVMREIRNRNTEGSILGNIGNVHADLGDARKAIEFYEQALFIAQEIGDRRNEGIWLGNLGSRYVDLGDARKAIAYHEQALVILRETGNRSAESFVLDNLGFEFLSLTEYQKAEENYQQAIQIADEISFPTEQNSARWGLAQAYLFQNNLVNARDTIEAALQYDVPQNNHNVSALHGIIALRQGERETAQEAFTKSIAQADEILSKTAEYYSALDAKGLALCGLILCRGAVPAPKDVPTNDTGRGDPAPTVDDAIKTFRKARKIAPHAGIVKSVLLLFDELMKCEGGEILKDVRNAVEGVE